MLVGLVASFIVNVIAVVDPSNFLQVIVEPTIDISNSLLMIIEMNCARVGAAPSAAMDSVIAVVKTAVATLAFIVVVRSPAVGAFVKFVTVSTAVMFVVDAGLAGINCVLV